VNEVLEALAQLSPPVPVTSLRQQRTATATVEARTCYDHLAGRRGVQLRDRLLDADAIRLINDRDHVLTAHGHGLLANVGLDPAALPRRRVSRAAASTGPIAAPTSPAPWPPQLPNASSTKRG